MAHYATLIGKEEGIHMLEGYTVFFSYMFTTDSGYGYKDAIHCNYINAIQLTSITNKEVNIFFENLRDFKFFNVSGGTGITVNKIYVLVQLINNTQYSSIYDIKPIPTNWKKYDVTDQISGYTSGQTLTGIDLTTTIFKVPLYLYNNVNQMPTYDLSYLNYPAIDSDDDLLCFGDEEYFIGNVESDIEAIAYTTDLAIQLPLNQFNSSTNETWDGTSEVYITEIGLYDENKNLVGIAKLNNPIPKDATIARTLVFGLDF